MKAKLGRKLMLTTVSLTMATNVLAHPGHDHSHWSSEPLHMMLYGAMAVAAAAGSLWMGKTVYRAANKEPTK